MATASELFRQAAGVTDEWDTEPAEPIENLEEWANEKLDVIDRVLKGSEYPLDAKGKPIPPPPTPEQVERERKRRKRKLK